MLQQHLPFTVLKRAVVHFDGSATSEVATALTVYGIETVEPTTIPVTPVTGCNSTYRLRY